MSRKHILDQLIGDTAGDKPATRQPPPRSMIAGRGAFGSVTRSIDEIAARADEARELEARLTSGQIIVELDPTMVDPSFIRDRLSQEDDSYLSLRESISSQGQESPILVRPHPEREGRYQVAFGHRRLRAARDLERPVRAVIRRLSDKELVLAQGQENSARSNLSYIEKAQFAKSLEIAGYDRELIMSALSVDKAAASRLLAVATKIPKALIQAIGPAPSVGRGRWVGLAEMIEGMDGEWQTDEAWTDLIQLNDFALLDSDDRFASAVSYCERQKSGKHDQFVEPVKKTSRLWTTNEGTRVARIVSDEKSVALLIDKKTAPGFGEYLVERMQDIYSEYTRTRES